MKHLYVLLLFCTLAAEKKDVWVNIYIHGTITPHLSMSDFLKVLNHTQKKSIYAEITRFIRTDPFFHQAQPIQELNLKKAFPTKSQKGHGANIFAEFYDKISKIIAPDNREIKHYTFGWSGLLSNTSRRKSAQKLFEQLHRKLKKMEMQNLQPHVRIIGYSHGGTLALYLGDEAHKNRPFPFFVEELILISTPIQEDTKKYVSSPLFKRVFSFYSKGDRVQGSDFLSSPDYSFSHQKFLDKADFKVPHKVTQIQIRFLRKNIYAKHPDGSIKKLHRRQYVNPGHTEMFFFGWAADWYRKHFPITPLPTALVLQLPIHHLKKQPIAGTDLRATIIPEDETIIIKDNQTKEEVAVPFFTKRQFASLRRELGQFKPHNYREQYKEKVKEAKEKAKTIFKGKLRRKHRQRKLTETKKPLQAQPIVDPLDSTTLRNRSSKVVVHVSPKSSSQSH